MEEQQRGCDLHVKSWNCAVENSVSLPNLARDSERMNCGASTAAACPQANHKRPKLEIRRAELHAPHVETGVIIKQQKDGTPEFGSVCISQKETIKSDSSVVTRGAVLNHGVGSQQCIAFIEAKGRQCVRWANDGDVYCCVHLSARYGVKPAAKERNHIVSSPICEGTTTHGNRCKHRSLSGSQFCKKHRCPSDSPVDGNCFKRKREVEVNECKDIVLAGGSTGGGAPLQVNPVSVLEASNSSTSSSCFNDEEDGLWISNGSVTGSGTTRCIGLRSGPPCTEMPKRCSLYCENHVPNWLKNKSRVISKEVFVNVLGECSSEEQKLQFHRACELFYNVFAGFKPEDSQIQCVISEVQKDLVAVELLVKLVCGERERLERLWGFENDVSAETGVPPEPTNDLRVVAGACTRCKLCGDEFCSDEVLSEHWMAGHKKELQWLFRGYACSLCSDSFTNRKNIQAHVEEKHRVAFVEDGFLLRCIPCGERFGDAECLWAHVLSAHRADFQAGEDGREVPKHDDGDRCDGPVKFVCRLCGLKFDLLPDLGRHHQAAHRDAGAGAVRKRAKAAGMRLYACRLKSRRLNQSRFRKSLKQRVFSVGPRKPGRTRRVEEEETEVRISGVRLNRLSDRECSSVARLLFSGIRSTRPRAGGRETVFAARSACCASGFRAQMEKYGEVPSTMHLKAVKMCLENDIEIGWYREGFVCRNRCEDEEAGVLGPLPVELPAVRPPLADGYVEEKEEGVDVEEGHRVVPCCLNVMQKGFVLSEDISSGRESVPVRCVVDRDKDSLVAASGRAWAAEEEDFTYVVSNARNHEGTVGGVEPGCFCGVVTCSPESCDHVYLFDTDYVDARDVYGKSMRGRFPYDYRRRIVLEEGYMVYECNQMCGCSKECPNRVLQNGVQVRLELFRTRERGWGVRAGEPLPRGTFVCEVVGEVLDVREATRRRETGECVYFYEVDEGGVDDMGRLMQQQQHRPYVFDLTRYGNVSRFIVHRAWTGVSHASVCTRAVTCVSLLSPFFLHRPLLPSLPPSLCQIKAGEELTYRFRRTIFPHD